MMTDTTKEYFSKVLKKQSGKWLVNYWKLLDRTITTTTIPTGKAIIFDLIEREILRRGLGNKIFS